MVCDPKGSYNFFSHFCLHFILQTINIMVNTGNRTLSLPVETASLVSRVMEQIQEKDGIEVEIQYLIFAGKKLKEDIRLYMYGVQQGSTLHMNLRLKGGAARYGLQCYRL